MQSHFRACSKDLNHLSREVCTAAEYLVLEWYFTTFYLLYVVLIYPRLSLKNKSRLVIDQFPFKAGLSLKQPPLYRF